MFGVTINNLWLKCYLKLFKLVPVEMGGLYVLAVALNGIYLILEKNIKKDYNCFFATLITNSSSSAKIVQQILSFSDKFNALTTSVGIVVLKDFRFFFI